jgi:dTDP-glucose 4,6-dehydratase
LYELRHSGATTGTAMTNPLAHDLKHVAEHSGDVWNHLQGARIFVTGGTGFFGCWLLESFAWVCNHLSLDASLTVLTRSPEAFRRKAPHLAAHPAIHLLPGDIRSFPFPAGHFSHVIHGATEASATLNRDQPLLMMDTIVNGTRRALDFAVAAQAQRFLMLSSGLIYGPQPSEMARVPETYGGGPDPTDPRVVYAEAKRLGELLCALYSRTHGLVCPIARCFAFVGPHLPLGTHFAIGNFIGDCLNQRPIEIRGDGIPYRSYLYAADLAIWLWTILTRGESCRPYNVGSERELSIAGLAATVAAELEPSTAIRVMGLPFPGAAPERYVPDTSRARLELGLRELVPLEDAIRRTAKWYAPGEVGHVLTGPVAFQPALGRHTVPVLAGGNNSATIVRP